MPDGSQMRSEVAVVLPCYNAESTLQRALDSVFAQTYRNCHVCAVDDGSTDRTLEVLAANSHRCSYLSQIHRGPAAARNRAIQMSNSPFLAFLDADDRWLPAKLQRQMALLQEQPDVGLVCSTCLLGESEKEGGRALPRNVHPTGRLFQELISNCFVFTPTVVIRRGCLEDVGLFRESLAVSEDFNLWLRIAARWRIAYLQEPLVVVHKRPASLSATVPDAERLKNGIAALEDVRATCGQLSPLEARALAKALAERFYFYGSFLLKTGGKAPARKALASSLSFRMSHWRALAKLAASFLPLRLFQSLLHGITKSRRRSRIRQLTPRKSTDVARFDSVTDRKESAGDRYF